MSIQIFIESEEVVRMAPRFWMFVLYVCEVQESNLELEDLIVIGQIRYDLPWRLWKEDVNQFQFTTP